MISTCNQDIAKIQSLEVTIISSDIILGHLIKPNWKKAMQKVKFMYKNKIYYAIDNLEGVSHGWWKGNNYQKPNQKAVVYLKPFQEVLWINILFIED